MSRLGDFLRRCLLPVEQQAELNELADELDKSRQRTTIALSKVHRSSARTLSTVRRSIQADAETQQQVGESLEGIHAANEIMQIKKAGRKHG